MQAAFLGLVCPSVCRSAAGSSGAPRRPTATPATAIGIGGSL